MSADTQAERIREIGRKIGSAVNPGNEALKLIIPELSAAEKAARKEEREQCCKDVCEDCKEGSEPNLISGVWQHHYQGEDIPSGLQGQKFNDRAEICKAASIRNRE